MSHIDNLLSILEKGLYSHDNIYKKIDISDCDVNSRRSRSEPIFNKPIHSYVPFYFNPKNNMLSRRRNIQNDILILVFKKELLFKRKILFTDGNASCDRTCFYEKLGDLDNLDWDCIYTRGYYNDFEDGARTRMSEVLIPDYVSVDNIEAIICNNFKTKSRVERIAKGKKVLVNSKFYF